MDAESKEQEQNTRPLSSSRWFFVPIIACLIYILGSGPASRLGTDHVLPFRLIEDIYSPLNSICFAHESTTRIYCWYLKLWGVNLFLLNGRSVYDVPTRAPFAPSPEQR